MKTVATKTKGEETALRKMGLLSRSFSFAGAVLSSDKTLAALAIIFAGSLMGLLFAMEEANRRGEILSAARVTAERIINADQNAGGALVAAIARQSQRTLPDYERAIRLRNDLLDELIDENADVTLLAGVETLQEVGASIAAIDAEIVHAITEGWYGEASNRLFQGGYRRARAVYRATLSQILDALTEEGLHRAQEARQFAVSIATIAVGILLVTMAVAGLTRVRLRRAQISLSTANAALGKLNETLEQEVERQTRHAVEAQQFLYAVVNSSDALIYAKGLNGRYLFYNEAWRDAVLEPSLPKDAAGKAVIPQDLNDGHIYPEELLREIKEREAEVLDLRKTIAYEQPLKQGPVDRVYQVRKSPIIGLDGEMIGLAAIATDVTQIKEIEAEAIAAKDVSDMILEELEEIRDSIQLSMQSLVEGMLIVDQHNRIILLSSSFQTLLNTPPNFLELGRILDDRLQDSLAGDDVDAAVAELLHAAIERDPLEEMIEIQGRTILTRVVAVPSGGVIVAASDITDLRRAEKDAVAARKRAEDALHELQATQQQLVESEKLAALGGLVAGVAHELNTPIGIALTAATSLEERVKRVSAAMAEGKVRKSDIAKLLEFAVETCTLMEAHCRSATNLIQSFKKVSVDQTSSTVRTFLLGEYIDEIITSLRPTLRKSRHEVSLNCKDDIFVHHDAGAFSQIVTNLIMNALNHAFDGREDPGLLAITCRPLGDDGFEVEFADNGKGLSEEVRRRIFEPFFTTKRGKGGSGLGMQIVHNIATKTLGGDIQVGPAGSNGATFTLRAPVHSPTSDVRSG